MWTLETVPGQGLPVLAVACDTKILPLFFTAVDSVSSLLRRFSMEWKPTVLLITLFLRASSD